MRDGTPHCAGVTGAPVHPEDRALAELSGQHGATAIAAAGIDSHDPLHWAGLLAERVHEPRQPDGTVVGDDHRGHHMLGEGVVR